MNIPREPHKFSESHLPELHRAVRKDEIARIDWLIQKDVDLNAQDEFEGQTALHRAADGLKYKIVPILIEAGADVNIRDVFGRMPLCLATNNSYGAFIRANVVENLIKAGADVNNLDKFGWTPLFRAEFHNRKDIVRRLIESGAGE